MEQVQVYDMPKVEFTTTEDGSVTLFDPALGVHYRSLHGAHTESRVVFLQGTGLQQRTPPWQVLELGFGGAINFLQTAQALWDQHEAGSLEYHTVEWAPIASEVLDHPEYGQWVTEPALLELAKDVLRKAQHRRSLPVSGRLRKDGRDIHLVLYPMAWEEATPPRLSAHAVFHDPFGPRANPEGWTAACFRWANMCMRQDGVLATYSAASHVRAAMVHAGLHIATAPGPGRKREITLASPIPEALCHHTQLSRERYMRKDPTPPARHD